MSPSVELFLECHAALGNNAVRVLCRHGFDQHDSAFLAGNGRVTRTARHDTEFAGVEVHIGMVFEGDFQAAADHEEQFASIRVVMSDELTSELGGPDVLVVDLVDDTRRLIARDLFQRLGDLYSVSCEHDALRRGGRHRR